MKEIPQTYRAALFGCGHAATLTSDESALVDGLVGRKVITVSCPMCKTTNDEIPSELKTTVPLHEVPWASEYVA